MFYFPQILFVGNIFKDQKTFQLARSYECVWALIIACIDSINSKNEDKILTSSSDILLSSLSSLLDEWRIISLSIFNELSLVDNCTQEKVENAEKYLSEISKFLEKFSKFSDIDKIDKSKYEVSKLNQTPCDSPNSSNSSNSPDLALHFSLIPLIQSLYTLATKVCNEDFNALRTYTNSLLK